MTPLTKKQFALLQFLESHIRSHGYAPSYREIAEHFELSSPATVHGHIQTLLEKGYVRMSEDGEARSLELTTPIHRPAPPSLLLPLAGIVTAGEPIEAIEQPETMAVPMNVPVSAEQGFVLKVRGDSMIEDGILDGDYVVLEKQSEPNNGDQVVALIEGTHATLKRFYKEKNRIRLQPANARLKPLFPENCIIQGVVKAVIRLYK